MEIEMGREGEDYNPGSSTWVGSSSWETVDVSCAIASGKMDPKNTMRRRNAVEERMVMQARRRRNKFDGLAIVVGMKMLLLCMDDFVR